MALVIEQNMTGMTTEHYDAINKEMGFPDKVPDGLLSHVAAKTDDGLQITDVWESMEKFTAFIQDELMPAVNTTDYQPPLNPPTPLEVYDRWPS
jgi:hypothetical protein